MATPIQHVAAELNAEGTDYFLLPDDVAAPATYLVQQTLQQLLGESAGPLTQQEILECWSSGWPPAAKPTCTTRGNAVGLGRETDAGTFDMATLMVVEVRFQGQDLETFSASSNSSNRRP